MGTVIRFIPSVASLLLGGGLQLSGVVIPQLGFALMVLAGVLLLIPAWSYLRRFRFRSPITAAHSIAGFEQTRVNNSIACRLPHSMDDEREHASFARTWMDQDQRQIEKVVETTASLQMSTIFSYTFPYVQLRFDIRSSSVYRLSVGAEIRGYIKGTRDPRLGNTPQLVPEKYGKGPPVELRRGETKSLILQQIISSELRDRWCHRVARHEPNQRVEIELDLSDLFINLELLHPETGRVVSKAQMRLPVPDRIIGNIPKDDNWDWSKYGGTAQ